MSRMKPFQFAAQSFQARSLPVDAQQLVNMFVERMPKDAKSPVPIYMAPGLALFSRLGTGPINMLHGMAGTLYALSGRDLYSINQDGLATFIGSTNLGGITSAADNDYQLVMVDGNVGWVYQPGGLNQVTVALAAAGATAIVVSEIGSIVAGDTIMIPVDSGITFTTTVASAPIGVFGMMTIPLSSPLPSLASAGAVARVARIVLGQIVTPAFQPASTVVYFDSYFILDARGTNQFFLSALGDGTQYDGLDFASAQANPDYILAVVNYHEQLLLMGSKSIEVWYDSGAANFPFQRFDGAYVQRGVAGPLAIAQEDNTVLFLGDDLIFYRLDSYRPVRISTFATEHAWGTYVTCADANCFVVNMEGHKFLFMNFPSAKATWCYDIASGIEEPLWHERVSWGSPWA